jgi:hypothetical protein
MNFFMVLKMSANLKSMSEFDNLSVCKIIKMP